MRVYRAQAFSAWLAIALFCGASQAQPANPPISDKQLVIATKEAPPFVMKGRTERCMASASIFGAG
jgi:hypothetical protein